MGGLKNMMMEREDNLRLATDYLVSKNMLEKCEAHDEVFGGGNFDLEKDFWRNSMADRNRGKNGPVPWATDLEAKEFTNLLKEAYESNCGDGCGSCAKHARE